jgi:hypothetical protein
MNARQATCAAHRFQLPVGRGDKTPGLAGLLHHRLRPAPVTRSRWWRTLVGIHLMRRTLTIDKDRDVWTRAPRQANSYKPKIKTCFAAAHVRARSGLHPITDATPPAMPARLAAQPATIAQVSPLQSGFGAPHSLISDCNNTAVAGLGYNSGRERTVTWNGNRTVSKIGTKLAPDVAETFRRRQGCGNGRARLGGRV